MLKTATALLLILLAPKLINAAVFDVTRLDDPVPDECSPSDCSLREAIIAANADKALDTVNLLAGVHLIDFPGGADNSDETGDLDIRTDLNVVGNDGVIDGQMLGRIMDIRMEAHVTMSNLTLRNGNSSIGTNGEINGGALAIGRGSLTLSNVDIVDNLAQVNGGGIYAYSGAAVFVENGFFSGNQSANGAGIYAAGEFTVLDSTFDDNEATTNGGALYLVGDKAASTIERTTLVNNISRFAGGAIWFAGAQSTLTIDGLIATGNHVTSGSNGGAIGIPTAAHSEVQITNSVFEANEAGNGGAISTPGQSGTFSVSHSLFRNNIASNTGAAIHVTGGLIEVTNVTFNGNEAVNRGGAVFNNGDPATVRLIHTTISDAIASEGSGIYVMGKSATVQLANNLIFASCDSAPGSTLSSAGGNVEGPGDTCQLDSINDLTQQNTSQLGLLTLGDNGGDTLTQQLSDQSVAIGNGYTKLCRFTTFDQRYAVRDAQCDSGAVEAGGAIGDLIFRDDNENTVPIESG